MNKKYLDNLKTAAKKYIEIYDIEKVAEYVHEHCKEEEKELLRQADMILNQTFIFQDKWDMEPCNIPYTLTMDTWLESPNGDEEWVFMLNRHDFLYKLWYAYLLTGKSEYANKLRFYMFDWIEKNPITLKGTDATRTIDTGIRCMNWCGLILPMYAKGIVDDEEVMVLLRSMGAQFENLCSRYIDKYSLSNWGVLQTTAMCAAYAWYRDFLPEDIEYWAWNELATQMDLQILEDGAHWEQSAMYHVEVLNTCVKLLVHLKNAATVGIELSDAAKLAIHEVETWNDLKEASAGPGEGISRMEAGWLTSAVRVLSRHVLYTAEPNWKQLPQCDSDVTDIKDVMVRATVLLRGSGIYRFAAGESMDMDSLLLLGAEGIECFHETKPQIPQHLSWNCADAGNIFFRTKWNDDAHFTWVKSSTLGSGHGHADQTHLNITYQGKPFLVDSGRYTYREDEPLRMELKSPKAHNVCVIDDESGGEADTSWTMASYGEVMKNYFKENEKLHYIEMPFYGILKDGTSYVITRKVLVADEGVWLSIQDITCEGEHVVKEYLHLDDKVNVTPDLEGCILDNDSVVMKVHAGDGELILEEGVISKKYNELVKAPVLVKNTVMKDRMTNCMLFAGENISVERAKVYQVGKNVEMPEDVITAWDICISGSRKYTFIVWNRETYRGGKMYICHGIPVYGKAVVLHWEEGQCKRIRLKT